MSDRLETDESLQGLRILVVEDSFLIACSLRRMLTELGCEVVGPVSTVAAAVEFVEQGRCDAAILDINLGVETSVPVATLLAAKGVPFVFVTGYTSPTLTSAEFSGYRRLRKPVSEIVLRSTILQEFVRGVKG